MASDKQSNELSEQELIDLLESEKLEKAQEAKIDVLPAPLRFLSVFNIQPGKCKITGTALYRLFKAWNKEKITKQEFYNYLNDFLPKKRTHYLINEKDLNLSQRIFLKLQETVKKPRVNTVRLKEHIDKYLKEFGFERGTQWVSIDELHTHYWTWAYNTSKTRRIYMNEFIKVINLYFETKNLKGDKIVVGMKENEIFKKEEKSD